MDYHDLVAYLNSAKTACESLGIDSQLLSWLVTLLVVIGIAVKLGVVSLKTVRGAYRLVSPKDHVADRLVELLSGDNIALSPKIADKDDWLGNDRFGMFVKLDRYEDLGEIKSVWISGGDSQIWPVLPQRSQRRVFKAADAALRRWRAAQQAARRKSTLDALNRV